mmetsp:Transcript_9926/g.15285  ORF Transcript_9926/g.15285 Transcript_9926/m.15285 type:complete len:500 (-) Transcript_9926:94-1593(-)
MKRPLHVREGRQRRLNGLIFVLLASKSCCSTVVGGHSNRGNKNNIRRRLVTDNIFNGSTPSQSEQPTRSLLPTTLSMSQPPSKTPSHTPGGQQLRSSSDDNGGSSSSIGLIAGVSAAGALLAVAALGFLRCRRRHKITKPGYESEKSRRTRERVMELIERKDWRGLHTAAREATGEKGDQAILSEAALPTPSDDGSSSSGDTTEMDATEGKKSPCLGEYLARSSVTAAASPKNDECENDETTESSSTALSERQKQAIQINKVQEPVADTELDKVNRGSYWSNNPNEASDDPFRARLKELAQDGDYKKLLLALETLQHNKNNKDGNNHARHSNRPKKSRSKRRKYRGSDPPEEPSDCTPFKSYLDEVHETSSRSVGYAAGGLEDIMESEDEQFEDTDTDGGMSESTDEVEYTLESFSESRSQTWGKKTFISTRKSSRNSNKGNLKDPSSYDDQSEGDFTSVKVTERSWDGLVSGINDPYSADVFGEPFYTDDEQSKMRAR